ncbi:MAG: tRNA (adenosine(37)-N6)-threonylcarbamoyltransferase complex dimerization subunit type 1 TsaB [Clostridiales bacterium]|jgi:tRNA threonylcarbamoyladenosine biosynthesis protein TsaB|nr:tRNA (adenosine(37)-N6)-threonylcarbamoyltransferase complex dimerization subunit type 1 TsaB [Clostridiales bacterium]
MCKILSIEATGKISSVCVYDLKIKKVLGEINLDVGYTHSETLLIIINDLLNVLRININKINYIACSQGPGSFTGIKIGVATAKALAHALNIKIIAVNTLDSMTQNIVQENCFISPVIDSRRGEVFGAIYEYQEKEIFRISDFLNTKLDQIINIACEISKNNNNKKKIFVCGDGVASNISLVLNLKNKNKNIFFDARDNRKSVNILNLAINYLKKDINIYTYDSFLPFYLRKHEAEL